MNKQISAPAVKVAKRKAGDQDDHIIELAIGGRVKLVPVSATLITEVTSMIPDPPIPVWHNEEKGRDEPNPDDPEYHRLLEVAETERGLASMDAMVMFGVELEDGLPENDAWLKKLKYMEKMGKLDLSKFDLEDEVDLEFLYKRFIAVPADMLSEIARISGISDEEVESAEKSFPGDEAR